MESEEEITQTIDSISAAGPHIDATILNTMLSDSSVDFPFGFICLSRMLRSGHQVLKIMIANSK